MSIRQLRSELSACRLCAARFAETATRHAPRPVVWFQRGASLLIVGQAPGMRVHETGRPFNDPSGQRLRAWLGISDEVFYDQRRIAIVPMAFCFPGYDAKGADLPPPKLCAETWRHAILAMLKPRLIILVGGYAQKWHLGKAAGSVTDTVARWQDFAPDIIPLPHPSWRNTGWLRKNPWFETELLPVLQKRVAEVLAQ